jgi:hypothetical protein
MVASGLRLITQRIIASFDKEAIAELKRSLSSKYQAKIIQGLT